jgi:hypothetical protein
MVMPDQHGDKHVTCPFIGDQSPSTAILWPSLRILHAAEADGARAIIARSHKQ